MKKYMIFAAIGFVVIGSILLSACSYKVAADVPEVIRVQSMEDAERKITLNASETVKVVPDKAEITYGITTENADAVACQQENAARLDQLLEYLKGAGIAENSIKTSGFSMDPRYDWSDNKQTLIGYEMRTMVTVTDISMDQVGSLLSKGVENGANEIETVSYFSSEYDKVYAEALTRAVDQARGKAEALAAAAGRKVGDVLNIQEYGNDGYGRYVDADYRLSGTQNKYESASLADMGVMPGEMEVTASISIDFALLPVE